MCACQSPAPIEFDKSANFSHYHGFDWIEGDEECRKGSMAENPVFYDHVRFAIIAQLLDQGFRQDCVEPNFLVTFYMLPDEHLRIPAIELGIGYGKYLSQSRHSLLFEIQDDENLTERVLVIDIIDNKRQTLVWRGWEKNMLLRNDFSLKGIQLAVQKILVQFPPD